MSLQVWLPLNRSTISSTDLGPQLGLSDASVTIGGPPNPVQFLNGKIGLCREFFTNTNLGYTPNFNITGLSFGGWFKFNQSEIATVLAAKTYTSSASTPTGQLIGNSSYGGLGLVWIGNNYYNANAFNSMQVFATLRTPTVNNSTSAASVEFDQWIHFMLTWNPQTHILSFYKNGTLIGSKTFNDFSDGVSRALYLNYQAVYGGNGPSANIPMYVNDVRIYDHCLSAKEVKEISKGLVLHYKLNQNFSQLNNCYTYPTFNTSSANGGWNHWGPSGHSGAYSQNTNKDYIYNKNNTYSHCVDNTASATGKYYLCYQSPAFDGGYRSLSFIVKEANGAPITEIICRPGWNARNGGAPASIWTRIIDLGDGFYLCQVDGISQDGSNNLVSITVQPGYKIYVSEGYLENNKEVCSDILNMGMSNIVYDCSGYNYTGTPIEAPLINTDTARYNLSTSFNGTTQGILIENLQLSNILNTAVTYSFWIKPEGENGARSVYFGSYSGTSWSIEKTAGNKLRLYWNGSPDETATATIVDGEWQHIAITKNGTNDIKVYLNGEQVWTSTATHNNLTFPTTYRIGRDTRTGATSYKGLMSDFRIYATALTPAAIQELYHTSATIDKSGNVYAREVVEI